MGEWATAADAAGAGTATAGSATSGLEALNTAEGINSAGTMGDMSIPQTVGSYAPEAGAQLGDKATVGDWLKENVVTPYERFNSGQANTLGKAWEMKGNNPETYGFMFNKLQGLGGSMGKATTPAAKMTVINKAPESGMNSLYSRWYRR